MVLEGPGPRGAALQAAVPGAENILLAPPPSKRKVPTGLSTFKAGGGLREGKTGGPAFSNPPPREYWPSRVAGEWGGRSCPPCPLTLAPLGCSGLEEAFKAAPNPS